LLYRQGQTSTFIANAGFNKMVKVYTTGWPSNVKVLTRVSYRRTCIVGIFVVADPFVIPKSFSINARYHGPYGPTTICGSTAVAHDFALQALNVVEGTLERVFSVVLELLLTNGIPGQSWHLQAHKSTT
jgi:hypothetical protein